ncbi:MAG TPA: hypothetical protein VFZ61_07655, partial [Polyangiales bacterium]
MSVPPAITCESCRELLIELVCEELPPERAAEVRAHALRCERCGRELEKLTGTLRVSRELPLLSPSPEFEQRVMQAARDAMARRARGPAREAEASAPASSKLTAWFARLGSFAMSPQVAMASVLLLVIGIGLYALPLGHQPEPTALRAAEDEAPTEHHSAESPAASATAVPVAQGEIAGEEVPAERVQETAVKEARGGSRNVPLQAKRKAETALRDDFAALESAELSKAKSAPRAFPESKAAPADPESPAAKRSASKPQKNVELEGVAGLGAASSGGGGGYRSAPKPQAAQPAPSKLAPAREASDPAADTFSPPPPAPVAAAAPSGAAQRQTAEAERDVGNREKLASGPTKGDAAGALVQGIAAIQRGDHALGQSLLTPLLGSS